ncbi:MAG TPA: hypothetical protein DEB39_15180 [Planctomycetaceae bacterium]|nr:hypothetical protein [Planctomycetaceae bacterium]
MLYAAYCIPCTVYRILHPVLCNPVLCNPVLRNAVLRNAAFRMKKEPRGFRSEVFPEHGDEAPWAENGESGTKAPFFRKEQ